MSDNHRHDLVRMYEALLAAYGPQKWWPAQTDVEVAVGAILTQNTSWKNVERAIASLKQADLLDLTRLDEVTESRLAELLRPAGTYRVKARRVRAFARWVCDRSGGNLSKALSGELREVRRELLSIEGIGPETADAILLYAGGRRSFVVDAYTRRLLRRHGLIESGAGYAEIQALFTRVLPKRSDVYNEYHALLVEVGKRHCRVRARCEHCPLAPWPHDADLTG